MKTSGKVSLRRLAVVGTAVLCALIILSLVSPITTTVSTGKFLSIGLRQASASPSFTARVETYVNLASLTTPYDITVTKNEGTVDDDILFCWIGWFSATATTIDSVPSGWTLLGDYTTNNDRYALYYKVASSEGASWDWSFSLSCKVRAVCSCYTGGDFDPDDPIDVISNTAYRTSDTACKAASMTVSTANSPLVFWAGMYSVAERTFTKPSVPTTDWIEDDDAGSTDPDFWTEICSMIWSGSGATGDMSATISAVSTLKHAFAVSLNPAPVGWANISHVKGIAAASISHINGIAVASISHVKGVAV